MEFSLESQGLQNMSYWQGVGVSGTVYEEVFTGIGNTVYEAAEDAIEMACQVKNFPPDVLDQMENMAQDFDDETDVCTECGGMFDGCDGIEESPDCDNTFVVALFVNMEG